MLTVELCLAGSLGAIVVVYACWQGSNVLAFRGYLNAESGARGSDSSIAVVIPFRNELAHLHTLVDSLLIQDFPSSKTHLIFVDDHSDDNSAAYLQSLLSSAALRTRLPKLSLLSLADHVGEGEVIAHKKAAIALAIAHTDRDIILTTDADCHVPQTLLSEVAKSFGSHVKVVSGPVFNAPLSSFVDHFQALDLSAYQFLTAVNVARGTPVLANGACFAFRRSAFSEVGGYAGVDHLPSGDDVLLLHKFRQRYSGTAFAYLRDGPVTDTSPVVGWRAVWRQRLRWAGKAGSYRAGELTLAQGLTYLTCCSVLLFIPLSLHLRSVAMMLLPWVVKLGVDYVALRMLLNRYDRLYQLRYYPFVALIYPFFLVAVGTAALLGFKTKWKGRSS